VTVNVMVMMVMVMVMVIRYACTALVNPSRLIDDTVTPSASIANSSLRCTSLKAGRWLVGEG